MRSYPLYFLFIINLLISSGTPQNTLVQSRIRLFENWLETMMDDQSLRGVSVGIVHKQNIVYSKGFGYADFENDISADDNINYKIASITKLFTSIAIMQLVEHEKISLNDPVIQHVPELKNIQSNEHNLNSITIKSILTHSTGLPSMVNYVLENNEHPISASKFNFLEELFNQSLLTKPNRIHKYSNLGMNLGGVIIERVTGLSYDAYIKKYILDPLKMTGSNFPDSSGNPTAVGYSKMVKGNRIGNEYNGMPGILGLPSAGLESNIIDLCNFIKWHFSVLSGNNDGSVISKETLEEMQTIHWVPLAFEMHPAIISVLSFFSDLFDIGGTGLGYFKNKQFTLHGGGINGFGSELIMDNDNEIGIIVLANSNDAPVYLNQDKSITRNLYDIVGTAIINSTENNIELKFSEYENIYTNNYIHHFYVAEVNGQLAMFNLRDSFPLNKPIILTMIGKDLFADPTNTGFYTGEFVIEFQRDEMDSITSLILVNEKLYKRN